MAIRLKNISIIMSLCMGVSALSGCSSNSKSKASVAASTPKTLTIGILSANPNEEDPNAPGEYINNNWATRYIDEKFAKPNNIQMKYQVIDDTNDAGYQNLQVLMAAKKAPDLFYEGSGEVSAIQQYAQAGALADLKPSLDKYGSHIKSFLTEDFINKYGNFQGKLLTIPGQEPIPAISHYWIRQDWLDALGLKMPDNFDDWYSVMKTFKQRAPELQKAGLVKNADDVIPYNMYSAKYFTPWERIVSRFYPAKYFDEKNEEYYDYSGYGTEYLKDGFKEGMQFMNKMYNEGLISKNFALDGDHKTFEREIVNGDAGSYCTNLFDGWQPNNPESWQTLLKKNIPSAKYEWCDTFTNKYDNVKRNPLDNPVLTYSVVPAYSKSVEEAVKYLDFVATPENMIAIQYGELGKSYDMDPVLGPMKKDKDALKTWGHKTGGRELVMLGRLPDRKWSRIQRSGATTKAEAEYAEKIHLGIETNGYERFPGILGIAPEKSLVSSLRTPWEKFVSNLIMAKPGDFENVWTAGVKELEANGSQKVVQGYKKVFEDNKAASKK